MSRQEYLQDLLAVHQTRLKELKKSLPVKSSFGKIREFLGGGKAKADKPEIQQEVEQLEQEIKRLQAELKKIEAASKQTPAAPVVQRETLSTTGFAPELIQTLRQAVALGQRKNKQIMTVEMVLQAILTAPEVTAHRLLHSFSQGYGFNWNTFSWYIAQMSGEREIPASNVDFVTDKNEKTPLAGELLAVLNRGAAIAKSLNESSYNTTHFLAAIAGLNTGEEQLIAPNRSPEGAAWLFQRVGITEQVITEALMGRSVPVKNEQPNRPASLMGRKAKDALNLRLFGDMFVTKVVTPLNLDTEVETQIRTECEWIFAAIDHYRQIQQIKVDINTPVPAAIPATAEKKDPHANNSVIAVDYLLPFNYNLIETQIDSLSRRINIYFNNLNHLLNQEANFPDAVPVNVALKNQIKGTRRELAKCLQEAATLTEKIYGVMVHSPAELVESLD